MPHPEDVLSLISGAIADGGKAAREAIAAAARGGDELEQIFWCYAALATFRKEGLDLIVDIALCSHKVKHKSAALSLFTTLAVFGRISESFPPFTPSSLIALVNARIQSEELNGTARHALRLLVLSLPTADLLISLSQSMMHLHSDLAEELVSALGTKWLRFGPPLLDIYDQMLNGKQGDEPAFQAFLSDYPQLLDPMAIQVWSQPDFHGALEPDFVIRRADDSYLVVEIECPAKILMTGNGLVSQLASHAEAQALEYAEFLSARIAEARMHFPNYRNADCLAVIGLERSLSTEQADALDRANSRKLNSRIIGFDWLLSRARTVVSNIGEGKIEVIKRHRVI